MERLTALLCVAVIAVAGSLVLGATGRAAGNPGNAAAGKPLFVADCGKCHAMEAVGSQGTMGPNLDSDKVPFTRVVTAITEGVGGIQAEYAISTACTRIRNPSGHKCLTFKQLYDIARFVVTDRKGGPGFIPYSAGSP